MAAKKFNAGMVTVSNEPLTVTIDGIGDVEIELNDADMDRVLGLRRAMANEGKDKDLSDPVEAMGAMFTLTTLVVKSAVKEVMSNDQAVQLIVKTGGTQGDMVRQLVKRFGVSDLLRSGMDDDGGSDVDDIPT